MVLPKEKHLCSGFRKMSGNVDFKFPPDFHFLTKKTSQEGRGENEESQVKILPCTDGVNFSVQIVCRIHSLENLIVNF